MERRELMSARGVEWLKKLEGEVKSNGRHRMYKDVAGLPTIGHGHLLTKSELTSGKIELPTGALPIQVKWRDGLSDGQAEVLLDMDLNIAEDTVYDCTKEIEDLQQRELDALVSFTFNVGIGAFRNSTLLKKLRERNFAAAASEFPRWVYAGGERIDGLINRRSKEKYLFLSGEYT